MNHRLIRALLDAAMLQVAAVQLSSQADVSANLERVAHWVGRAHAAGAELVVLPENFAFFGPEAEKAGVAERLGDVTAPIQGELRRLAAAHRVVLVGGGMPIQSGEATRPFNTAVVFGPTGQLQASYHKVHLFDVELPDGTQYRESSGTTAGAVDQLAVFDHGGVSVGLSVCYDLRFPELYRRRVDAGARVLLVPAAFTAQTGEAHWHVLLRARAIESQCWVVAAAQWGEHPLGRRCYGHSLVVDAWGRVVAQCETGEGLAVAALDAAAVADVRAKLPALEHRRG